MTTFNIAINQQTIGSEVVNAVNARELWERLEVKTRFNDWFSRQVDRYEFKEGYDFCVLKNEYGESRGFQAFENITDLMM